MSRNFEVITPEQVAIRYELAGFGSRGLAALLDTIYQQLIFLAVTLPIALLLQPDILSSSSIYDKLANSTLIGLLILLQFIITWGYWIGFETLWNGETPGKRVMRLRVIRDGGFPIDFRAALIRNLLRAVDVLPGLMVIPIYGCAFACVMCNKQYKRLGDFAAGTLVVRYVRDADALPEYSFGEAKVLRLFDAKVLSSLSNITREEMRLVQRYLEQRNHLTPQLRSEFASRLAKPLMEKIHYVVEQEGIDYERWLDELSLAYRMRSLGVVQPTSAVLSTPAVHAIVTATPTVTAPIVTDENVAASAIILAPQTDDIEVERHW